MIAMQCSVSALRTAGGKRERETAEEESCSNNGD